MMYTTCMTNNDLTVTYPRTISCICSLFDICSQPEWLELDEGEMIVDTSDGDCPEDELDEDEYYIIVTVDLISNVMTDDTPLNALAHAFSLAS